MSNKKKYICLIVFTVILCLCTSSCVGKSPVTDYGGKQNVPSVTYLTDINGKIIPAFENIPASSLSPNLFKKDESGRMYYDDASVKTYTGIDVSVFQGDIDWAAVKADGIDFVMLRAGYRGYGTKGKLSIDEKFSANAKAAKDAGLELGVYFFSQAINESEAVEEAEFLIDIIKNADITFPVAFDWEHIDYDAARTDNVSSHDVTRCAIAFCETVLSAGYTPLVYFNCELGYFSYELSLLRPLQFWLAEYADIPSFYYNYKMLQYSKTGKVNGIKGDVDLNILFFDDFDNAVG